MNPPRCIVIAGPNGAGKIPVTASIAGIKYMKTKNVGRGKKNFAVAVVARYGAQAWRRAKPLAFMARPFIFGVKARWWRKNLEPSGQREAAPHDVVELKTGN